MHKKSGVRPLTGDVPPDLLPRRDLGLAPDPTLCAPLFFCFFFFRACHLTLHFTTPFNITLNCMLNQIEKDKYKRKLTASYELQRLHLKALSADFKLPASLRFDAMLQLAKLPRNSSPVRIRKRCVITGRPRGLVSDFKMSRILFRHNALFGFLPGVHKSSW